MSTAANINYIMKNMDIETYSTILFGFAIFRFWAYLKVIPETSSVH
jgi:hypothetical protein